MRNQRESVVSALARAEAAEASRDEEARRRVAEERLRIARELHDAVAHHVSVVNVQAGVASHLLESDPPAAREALAHLRTGRRQVIGEMRVMVCLRRTAGTAELVEPPAPSLTEVPGLVARTTTPPRHHERVDQAAHPALHVADHRRDPPRTLAFGLISALTASGHVEVTAGEGGPPAFGGTDPVSTVLSGATFALLIVAVLGAIVGARGCPTAGMAT